MNSLYKKVELLSNVAIIVVAILLGAVLVKQYILGSPARPESKTIAAGTKIPLPDVTWEGSRQTLLLVLSRGCHFCSESVPFYQRLAEEVKSLGDVRLLAVLPQPPEDAQKYLDDLGVPVKDVKQADLTSIPVAGTPTLILVDSKGVVTDAWVGKLRPDKEAEVISKLQCDTCGP
ncbi:MAG: peroxiredoxin family protein [Blastocatellia bacterium]